MKNPMDLETFSLLLVVLLVGGLTLGTLAAFAFEGTRRLFRRLFPAPVKVQVVRKKVYFPRNPNQR